jgi:hypothetical protein
MFRSKPASQFVEQYHSVVSYALNMENLISKYFFFFVISKNNKEICDVFSAHFTNQLTGFWATL